MMPQFLNTLRNLGNIIDKLKYTSLCLKYTKLQSKNYIQVQFSNIFGYELALTITDLTEAKIGAYS